MLVAIGTVATVATAIFTGVSAWIMWRQHKGRLIAEWRLDAFMEDGSEPATISIHCTIRNNLPHGVACERMDIKGLPVVGIEMDHAPGKPDEWPATACGLYGEVAPRQSEMLLVRVQPDWEQIDSSSKHHRNRYITGTVTVASMEDRRKKIRLKRKMLVPTNIVSMSIAAIKTKPST